MLSKILKQAFTQKAQAMGIVRISQRGFSGF